MNLAQINESYELRNERLDFIPKNFKRVITSVSTASELDLKPITWGFPTAKTPLWRFPSLHGVVLSLKPVSVKISREKLFSLRRMKTLIFMRQENREMMLSVHFASN